MNNGIYRVAFSTPQAPGIGGMAVIDSGKINGWDDKYLYLGTSNVDGSNLTAKIRVKHYQGDVNSVFGPLKEFDLNLNGSSTDTSFTFTGHIIGKPQPVISITGTKIADLGK